MVGRTDKLRTTAFPVLFPLLQLDTALIFEYHSVSITRICLTPYKANYLPFYHHTVRHYHHHRHLATMAILPAEQASPAQPLDIEAWTVDATAAMSTLAISAPGETVQSPTVNLQIPLDDTLTSAARSTPSAAVKDGGYTKRKELMRRDSLKRREALLKGREGSRRRLRWENGMRPPLQGSLHARLAHPMRPTCCTLPLTDGHNRPLVEQPIR